MAMLVREELSGPPVGIPKIAITQKMQIRSFNAKDLVSFLNISSNVLFCFYVFRYNHS